LEEAAPYGYISSAGFLFVGSWLFLEALWWTYTTRVRPAFRVGGRISLTRHRAFRLLSPLLATIILYQIGFWTFGAVFFERNPSMPQSTAAWLLAALARTGVAIYATALALRKPLEQVFTKRNLFLAFFLIGPAHPLTQMTLLNLTVVTTWPSSLNALMLTGLLQPIQDAIKSLFETMGLPYTTFLIFYILALDPLLVELPRLITLILVNTHIGHGERPPKENQNTHLNTHNPSAQSMNDYVPNQRPLLRRVYEELELVVEGIKPDKEKPSEPPTLLNTPLFLCWRLCRVDLVDGDTFDLLHQIGSGFV
jgi:hypothetical protein